VQGNAFVSALPYLIMWLTALVSSVLADYVLGKVLAKIVQFCRDDSKKTFRAVS
jgi:hypothetical protein